MSSKIYPLIAFCGYGRSGKDEAAKTLIAAGYRRVAFGDIIKRQCDPLIREHFGFSAFTEQTEEKAKVRRTLESWGEDNYEAVFREFFAKLPPVAVNTRLCRENEAREWVRRGGIIVNVVRPGVTAETEWAREIIQALDTSGLIHSTLRNLGSLADLALRVQENYLMPDTAFGHGRAA